MVDELHAVPEQERYVAPTLTIVNGRHLDHLIEFTLSVTESSVGGSTGLAGKRSVEARAFLGDI